MADFEDRVRADLWHKYHKAKSDYQTSEQEIESLKKTIEKRKADLVVYAYWLNHYGAELEKVGEELD